MHDPRHVERGEQLMGSTWLLQAAEFLPLLFPLLAPYLRNISVFFTLCTQVSAIIYRAMYLFVLH
jgi:hypothetical protein